VKPSYRILPTVGIKAFSWSLDTAGLFAATVADAAFALAAITGRDELRVDGRSSAVPRIGVVTQDFAGAPEPASAAALEEAVRRTERAGATVRPVALAPLLAQASRSTRRSRTTRPARRWPGNTTATGTCCRPSSAGSSTRRRP
jgi:Asp-tRNA(Asn)/Glu-tRNA(Gln) amidotransferase A subunit family amidase